VAAASPDTSSHRGEQGSSPSATATIDAGGAATYEFDLHWAPEQLPDPAEFDLVHVGSIGAWMEPGANAVADLVRRAHDQGRAVGFDPNVRPTLGPPVPVLRQRVLDLASHSRFVKLSDEDASALADGGSPESVLRSLAAAGPALAAMTRGGASAVLRSGDHEVEVPVPKVTVADTIGAGDTWMGTLLAELLRRGWVDRTGFDADELQELGEVAVRASAITVSRPGADPPWRDELPRSH